MTNNFIDTDVLIIGGGPAGCACALYTARSALTTNILDKNPSVGALAITHKIANYPGIHADTSGADLLTLMRDQAIAYGTNYQKAQVYGIDLSSDKKVVYTPEGVFRGKALVLATGAMGRTSSLPGEEKFLGRGVSYCATCDGAFYKGKEVVVYGSNQEAIDEALVLIKFASKVHWITTNKPNQSIQGIDLLNSANNVKRWQRTRLISIEGNDEGVTQVKIKMGGAQDSMVLNVDGVFVYSTGNLPITDYLQGQIPLNKQGSVKVNDDMMTEMEGV